MERVAAARSYPKSARLRRRAEYLELQRDGRRRHTAHLVFIQRPASAGRSRLGVTVSKRVGNAVVRSRVKRLLREVFRLRQGDLPSPIDVVVIAKTGADTLSYAQAATEFAKAFDLPIGG